MELSEAIRLGAMIRPQCKDEFFKAIDTWSDEIGSCVLGAAYEATLGFDRFGSSIYKLEGIYPILLSKADYPCTCRIESLTCSEECFRGVSLIITHLNDVHGWTRELIADWVETIEQQVEQQKETETKELVSIS